MTSGYTGMQKLNHKRRLLVLQPAQIFFRENVHIWKESQL